ncbi:theronine dehydrogenase-like Zn-dependent dehydrogenase [Chthonomonas calidirosea]|uniref:Threonine dehydrogenase and related Zn-dependent dehydrogenases n=1 Tax=Chthonomonas calidirosea (strain DSM 23976 / ICMP 18418 / T49) TaxID=1303518 RepID=S0EZ03_CHTCT|nr:zinc-binding dehydrogenase [Chthonomonas calidirosea]CCW35353.1 Threonine dehydrogenase and related Zn-dependent dehydrogenases [Chthonomonas calidirosea T49]CEK20528.1 theronine dehydrogenase-like Zn-dependent dehydrogenase [Chthonomonas calidirosea]
MQAVRIVGKQRCELVECPKPSPWGDVVVIKVEVTPMCTEYKAYRDGYVVDWPGHEAAGEVAEIAQPGRVKVGDRVVVMPNYPCGRCWLCLRGEYIHCQHNLDILMTTGNMAGIATYAQFLLKPDWLLVPVPDDIPLHHAAMACCGLGPTFGAMERMRVNAFDTVLITGMGPVGLGGVINGVMRGAQVIAVEGHPYRAALARELGAAHVLDPQQTDVLQQIMEITKGVGVDKAIDCSGSAQAQRLLMEATRRKGEVTFVGEAGELTLHVSNDLLRKGLTLHGQWHYNLADTPRLMDLIRRASGLLEKFITHRLPLQRVQEAFETQLTGNCGKIVLEPWAHE